jgi:hypothetical protein
MIKKLMNVRIDVTNVRKNPIGFARDFVKKNVTKMRLGPRTII